MELALKGTGWRMKLEVVLLTGRLWRFSDLIEINVPLSLLLLLVLGFLVLMRERRVWTSL